MPSKILPDGWSELPLGDAARYINGRAFKPTEWSRKGLPIIRIQNLNDREKEFNCFDGEYDYKHYVENGDILISWSASLGVYVWDRGPAVLNQHIFKVLPNESLVDRRYYVYAVQTILNEMKSRVHGATMRHIVKGDFQSLRIPVPPLATQRRIADVLDRGERLQRFRQQANQLTGKIIQSVFLKMFGDPNNIQLDFQKEPLDDLVDNLDSRRVPLNEEQRSKRRGNVPYYGASGLVDWVDESLFDEPLLLVAEDGENLRSRKLPIAYSIFGKSWVNNHAHVLRCLRINQRYLEVWFNILDISAHLGGSTRPKLNKTTLMSMKVPVPPMDLQQKFAAIVEGIHRLKERQTESNQEINELFGSLISKAFRGELPATDGVERPTLESRKNGQTLDKYVA